MKDMRAKGHALLKRSGYDVGGGIAGGTAGPSTEMRLAGPQRTPTPEPVGSTPPVVPVKPVSPILNAQGQRLGNDNRIIGANAGQPPPRPVPTPPVRPVPQPRVMRKGGKAC